MSFKNGYWILFYLTRQMAASPFAHGQEQEPRWVCEESSDFIFLFILNRLCSPGGVGDQWNETLGWETNYAALHG